MSVRGRPGVSPSVDVDAVAFVKSAACGGGGWGRGVELCPDKVTDPVSCFGFGPLK